MKKKFEVDNYTKIGSLMVSTFLILDWLKPNWYSFENFKFLVFIGAPLQLYGLYKIWFKK